MRHRSRHSHHPPFQSHEEQIEILQAQATRNRRLRVAEPALIDIWLTMPGGIQARDAQLVRGLLLHIEPSWWMFMNPGDFEIVFRDSKRGRAKRRGLLRRGIAPDGGRSPCHTLLAWATNES